MAAIAPVEVHVADLPQMKRFITATGDLVRAMEECGELPPRVTEAAEKVRREAASLGARNTGRP